MAWRTCALRDSSPGYLLFANENGLVLNWAARSWANVLFAQPRPGRTASTISTPRGY
jgi:hypothetical protein